MFRLPTRNKTTWIHPRSRHWHLIDYVITRAKDRRNVRVTKAMCGADCCTGHRLINWIFPSNRRPKGTKVPRRLYANRLKCPETVQKLHLDLDNKPKNLPPNLESVEEKWASFRHAVHSATLETLGPVPDTTRTQKSWGRQTFPVPSPSCARPSWDGQVHVSRMQEDRIPKQLFYGELWFHEPTVDGYYKDSLKVSLRDFNISTESWEFLASDRPCWRQLITKGARHTQQRSEGPVKPRKSEQYARKEPPALTAQPLPTSDLPVREASLPGLVSSATSGHLWQFIIKLEVFGHLWLRRTSNNNSLRKCTWWQTLLKIFCSWTESSLMKNRNRKSKNKCDPLYPHPHFTADVMTATLVSGVTSQNKIIFHRFYHDCWVQSRWNDWLLFRDRSLHLGKISKNWLLYNQASLGISIGFLLRRVFRRQSQYK